MASINFRVGNDLDLDEVVALYERSTLGARRPIHHRATMQAMLQHASLVVTAWDGDRLVGIARTLTDFAYVAYLADLAVDTSYQKQGIGKRLILATETQLAPTCFIALLAAPQATEYYGKVGFTPHPRAWVRGPRLPPMG